MLRVLSRPGHPLNQFPDGAGLVLDAECHLAVGVHIEELGPGILKNGSDHPGYPVHGKGGYVAPVHPYLPLKLPGGRTAG